MDCYHKNKIAERLFNKFGKPVATLICCLKCGSQQKIKDNGKNRDRSNEVIQDTYKKRYDTKRLTQLD
jgi:hypothetical protein